MIWRGFILMVLMALFVCHTQAQDPLYRIINTVNGLPSNTVYEITQDPQGFVWFGHDKGLSRYDGKRFLNLKSNTQQGIALSNLISFKNVVYCQDFSGNFYYTHNDSLLLETRLPSKGGYNTAGILRDNILATCYAGSIRTLNLITKEVSEVIESDMFAPIQFFAKDKLYILNQKVLLQYDGNQLTRLNLPQIDKPFVYAIEIDKQLYGFRRDRFPYLFKISAHSLTPIPILNQTLFIQNINIIDDEIWVSTNTGAYCFNKDFTPRYDGHCFFKGTSISKIIKDREGNYWFSTLTGGVFIITNFDMRLYRLTDKSFTSIHSDTFANRLLAGTSHNEVLSFDDKNKAFLPIFKETINHDVVSIATSKEGLLFVNSDKIYLKKGQKNLYQLHMAGKSEVRVTDKYHALAYSNGITLISADATFDDVPKWLKNDSIAYALNTNYHYSLLNISTRGRWVNFDAVDSTLYAATTNGLFYFSPQGRGRIQLGGKEIFAAQVQVKNDMVYCATYTEGVLILKDKKVVQQITKKDGLSDNTVLKILVDNNHLWLLTNTGLQRYDLKNHRFSTYLATNSLLKADIKDIALYKNDVFVATTEGVLRFQSTLNTYNSVAPLLAMNTFSVNNITTPYERNMALEPEQNTINIDFSVLSFKSEDALSVQYKINDAEWKTMPSDLRSLSLPSLSSGHYEVLIRAFNENNVMSERPLEFHFTIKTPIYKQFWFLILVLAATVLGVYSYFKNRIRIINEKNKLLSQKLQLEQELQKSMLTSIKSQMNPHFLFNALNTIQSYIYTNDKENASVYLGKFSELTRLILEMSNKDYIPLSDELKALNLYLELEKIRFEDKLTYTLNVDSNISKEIFYIPSMLIQPYVENAIKHGLLHKKDDRRLSIIFAKEATGIRVSIEDNGIGRKRSGELNRLKHKKHESFSTDANQKRLDILNKGLKSTIALNITDKQSEYGEAIGTIVTLHIPNMKFID